jgi:succinate-semialdehyde dehydrogenase/glutarate-semialdehyde dehydrogenase
VIGSERAGQSVASAAGEELKKSVMELGGSDPFIVLRDADMNKVFPTACGSRLRNCGQSCNAAKRFIVEEEVAEEFTQKMKEAFESEVIGDPTDKNTTLGPVANQSALEGVQRQVEESVQKGAEVLTGGHGEFAKTAANWNQFQEKNNYQGYYYPPTLLTNVNKYMPVYNEEVFGPVAPIIVVQSTEEAIRVANDSPYGLGASLWTDDENKAKDLIPQIESGNVFVNSAVRSKIEMPYGGIKKSGYGREMGPEGILEFVNVKTVVLAE